ncbi:MAG TPA: S53 family peptidase [Trebonia sp.]|jgi:kumamolisin|nr:S53 family peptidase [Trebonia sp.]
MPDLVPLPGSERAGLPSAVATGAALDPQQSITITLVLRRQSGLPEHLVTGPQTISPDELAQSYGASPQDVALVRSTLAGLGLAVDDVHAGSRRVKVSGTIGALSAAFGTSLTEVTSDHLGTGPATHRYRTGGLSVPAALGPVVVAVLGLDDRPVARPQLRVSGRVPSPAAGIAPAAPVPLTAVQVATLYGFPAGTDGSGQVIAIIELGGGYAPADLQQYFSGLGLPVPAVSAVSVDGGANAPGQDGAADGEVALDIEVAGGVAPGAAQVVYFSTQATDAGFLDAVSAAVHATPTPAVISISWGGPEPSWSQQGRASLDEAFQDAAALGSTVTASAGDSGSSDDPQHPDGPVQVDFPASSPYALACGGTTLVGDPGGGQIVSEVAWNELAHQEGAGGGGLSTAFAVPSWQQGAAAATELTGRGVPDVAGNADPLSGYEVITGGRRQAIGGTSAVAPLWAGLIARLAQATGRTFGLLQPVLYPGAGPGVTAPGFRDITSGSNGAYAAAPGWDPVSGLGSPDGTALLARLLAPASPEDPMD